MQLRNRYSVWDCDTRTQILRGAMWAEVVETVRPFDPDALRDTINESALALDHGGYTIQRESAGMAWVGEGTLHRLRRLPGGGKLYVITEGPRRGERAIEHENGRLTILPPDILLSGGYKG